MFGDSTSDAAVPQVLVYEHDIEMDRLNKRMRFSPRHFLKSVKGPLEIAAWARAGAPLR